MWLIGVCPIFITIVVHTFIHTFVHTFVLLHNHLHHHYQYYHYHYQRNRLTLLVQRHPGGGAICQGARVDSTYYFNLFHGGETGRTYLPRYCIGYLGKGQEMPRPKNVDDNGDEIIQ